MAEEMIAVFWEKFLAIEERDVVLNKCADCTEEGYLSLTEAVAPVEPKAVAPVTPKANAPKATEPTAKEPGAVVEFVGPKKASGRHGVVPLLRKHHPE